MSRFTRKSVWIVTVLVGIVGIALLFGGSALMTEARAQEYEYACDTIASPCDNCGSTGGVSQCVINLNGWFWGACIGPPDSYCYENQSNCGTECDCSTPPNPIGGNNCGVLTNSVRRSDTFEVCQSERRPFENVV